MDKESFSTEFAILKQKFDNLKPELELTVRDPSMGVEGYVVVWNTDIAANGPLGRCGKGGTRITPSVSLDEVKMLAKIMSLKNAAAGLPLGGAKSGLRDDPDSPGFEKRYRRFVSLVKPVLRENGGIFGGFGFDLGAKPEHALWACDELKSTKSFTGKPLEMGGTDYDREGIAGLGVAVAAKTLLEANGESCEGKTFGVQGAGAMGAAVIRYFSEFGAKLRYLSGPICGATYLIEPQPPPELFASLIVRDHPRTISLLNDAGYKKTPIEEILYDPMDVFFPCAIQNVIRPDNVSRVKSRYIIEGANGPCARDAYFVLQQRGIQIVPDMIANPGGIIAAFIEMTSSISPDENAQTRKNVEDAKLLTRNRIEANVKDLVKLVNEFDILPVDAGLYLALKNIFPV